MIQAIPTDLQAADIFTKAFTQPQKWNQNLSLISHFSADALSVLFDEASGVDEVPDRNSMVGMHSDGGCARAVCACDIRLFCTTSTSALVQLRVRHVCNVKHRNVAKRIKSLMRVSQSFARKSQFRREQRSSRKL